MSNFRTVDRQTGFLLPPSVDDWIPERHLARFVVEVIEGLDLRSMSESYRGSGSPSYVIDIHGAWAAGRYRFMQRYRSGMKHNHGDEFDAPFARIDRMGRDRFNIYWMRHTGKWWLLHTGVTLVEALRILETDGVLYPV